MTKRHGIVLPVVAAVISLILFLLLSVGINYYAINQNNKTESQINSRAIAAAVAAEKKVEQQIIEEAIANNNKDLCTVIVLINKSAAGSSNSNNRPNSYTLRLRQDFITLAKEYKCGDS